MAQERLSVRANTLNNSGTLLSGTLTEVQVKGQITNQGDIQSQGEVKLSAEHISNHEEATIIADQKNYIASQTVIENSGQIAAGILLQLKSKQIDNAQSGYVYSDAQATLQAATLNNQGSIFSYRYSHHFFPAASQSSARKNCGTRARNVD